MEAREKDLSQIKAYIEDVETEVTMILQCLQWDRKHLLESASLATCRYNASHKVPEALKSSHEDRCLLNSYGYTQDHSLLPDPIDDEASTLVKLSKEDINQIIENAAKCDPSFKRGAGIEDIQPLTLERLQSSYTADERRAIHDAVVKVAPTLHLLSDLALPGGSDVTPTRERSRIEVLAELRDMKRRRTKYRTSARTSKYSDVLRDVIKTQMDLYYEALGVDQSYKLPENTVISNNYNTTENSEDTMMTKTNLSYHKEIPKNAITDNRYKRNCKETLSERPKHKHQDSRREDYDSRREHYDIRRENYDSKRENHEIRRENYDSKREDYDSRREHYVSRREDYGSRREHYDIRRENYDIKREQHDSRREQHDIRREHSDSRRDYYDSRCRNDSFEDRKRRDVIKHKHHHRQDRNEHRQSKPESFESKLDREIKKEPEEYSPSHSSMSYEDRSWEQSTSSYRNDSQYKDRQRLPDNEYNSCSRDYDSERSERNSKPTNRHKESHRRSEHYKYHERKRKHHHDRAIEDFYIRYKDIKREKSDDSATEVYIKQEKY